MKDLRSQPDPRELTGLLRGDTVPGQADADAAVRRTKVRGRVTAGVLTVVALAVVIGPHLIDATRISSVAERAAADANPGGVDALTCPASRTVSVGAGVPAGPVELETAVICRYPAAPVGAAPVAGRIPPMQMSALNADLQAHTMVSDAPWAQHGRVVSGRQEEFWALIGVTAQGRRVELVELIGSGRPTLFVLPGPGRQRVWRPSPSVQQMLTSDLAR